ncbi:MAG: hypothetical protein WC162_02330 [Sphaerochaetaceae bacterium]
MIKEEDIFKKNNNSYLMLGTMDKNHYYNNPLTQISSEREKSFIYKDGKVEERIFDIQMISNNLCLNLKELEISTVSSLATTNKKDALNKIKLLYDAYNAIGKKKLNLKNGILPLSRIYFISDGGVLIIPEQIQSLIFNLRPEGFNNTDYNYWICSIHPQHLKLELQLVQFMYFSLTGTGPFFSEQSRACNYSAIPLFFGSTDKQLASFIDNSLKMKTLPNEYQAWFTKSINSLNWIIPETDPLNNIKAEEFITNQNNKIKKSTFIKKKGTPIAIISLVVICVLYFIIHLIIVKTAPPNTRGMSPSQITAYYYQAQNNLDLEGATDSFVNEKDCPIKQELAGLFVSSKMRQAYENKNTIISPETWLNSGDEEISKDMIIYGNSDLSIEEKGPLTIVATSLLWNANAYSEVDEEDLISQETLDDFLKVYIYQQIQEFQFIQKKDYYEIISVTNVEPAKLIETREIPFKEDSTN